MNKKQKPHDYTKKIMSGADYTEFLKYLDGRARLGIKLGLDNIKYLLERLGSPQKRLLYIHIAGTNGKGSVAAMLSSVLTRAGIKVGLYTSPHLADVRERIKINDIDITEDEFLTTAQKVIPFALPQTTYFELLTAVALEYFCSNRVEIAIMETGMGGRLDATNVCNAEIAIITDISLEHTQYLGSTIPEITREKMAIVKEGSRALLSTELTEGVDYGIHSWNLDYQDIWTGKYNNLRLNLLGPHQARNCALAIKAIEVLIDKAYNISAESIYKGLANVNWPGRFQIISRQPLVILDGAHNPGAALAVKKTVETYLDGKEIILILGVLRDKDYKGIVDVLVPIAKHVITVTPNSDRALPGGKKIAEALEEAIKMAQDNTAILVTGSLYLAGEALNVGGPNVGGRNVGGRASNIDEIWT